MEIYKKQTLSETFSVYFDRRMIRILLLGVISGFPWVLIGSSLSLWLKEDGLSRSTIGWAGLIFAVYAFNYLWAPIIDRVRIPWLTNKIGHRRGWIVTMQLIILISLVCWSVINPTTNLVSVITVGLIIAIASATQDITVDALRIEQIGEDEGKSMQAGAAMAVVGWWTGYKLGGFIALNCAELFETGGYFGISFISIPIPAIENYWQATFLVLSVVIILCNIGLMFVHETRPTERQEAQKRTDEMIQNKLGASNFATKSAAWITGTIAGPIISFFKKNGFKIAIGILGFVFLFKIGEAFLGRMSIIFYKEIGFTKGDIALYSKGLGWITTVIFTLLGGLFAIRSGVLKAMFVAGILMASTNLLFSALDWYVQTISLVSYEFDINLIFKTFYFKISNHELFFALSVIFDDMAAAFATVAFVAFISMLVDRTYTATQYALLASIGTAGRTTLAASSGALVDVLENGTIFNLKYKFIDLGSITIPSFENPWAIFFIITAIMVIPSLIILYMMKDNIKEKIKGMAGKSI